MATSSEPTPINEPTRITMYGADWCGDCIRAKTWFDEREIAYEYVDLEANPDEVERVLERNGGVKRIPVIVFGDDSHLVEPTNAELEAKMAELAHAPAPAAGTLVDNTEARRFELHEGGELLSHAEYTDNGSTIFLPHVFTLPQHRGNGNAGRLMDLILDHARTEGRSITPICPFAVQHIADNPEYADLVA